jgi:hypothetical protein
MVAHKIIILSYYSPGDKNVGYRRMLYWANELADLNYSVTFVTLTEPDVTCEYVHQNIQFVWIKARTDAATNRTREKGPLQSFVKKHLGQLFHPWLFTIPQLIRLVVRKKILNKKGDRSIIIASNPPWHPLLLGYVLSRWYQCRLVVDFRDLFADSHLFSKNFVIIERCVQRLILNQASDLITVSQSWLNYFNHPKKHLITNGYDENLFLKPPSERVLKNTICYFGTITFEDRINDELLSLLRDNTEFIFEFYGDCRMLESKVSSLENVYFFEYVDYSQAIKRMQNSTANLLLGLPSNDVSRSGMLQTKAFEYMRAKRPILFLGDQMNSTYELVQPSGLIVSIDQIKKGYRPQARTEHIEKFSRQKGFEILLDVINCDEK